jgi:TatA/E family protein of Tat protein translocase
MGPLGWQETVFIFLLALLIFGPKKLPELGKTIGKALTEFRRASSELKSTWDREMVNLERENESLKDVTSSYQNEIASSTYDSSYDTSYYDSGYDNRDSYESTDSNSSTVSASAPQGAESTAEATTETAANAAAGDAGAEPAQQAVASGSAAPAEGAANEATPPSTTEAVKTT